MVLLAGILRAEIIGTEDGRSRSPSPTSSTPGGPAKKDHASAAASGRASTVPAETRYVLTADR